LPPKPEQASTSAPYSTLSRLPSGLSKAISFPDTSITLAEQSMSTPLHARSSEASSASPVFSGTQCMRSALWPG
jgi:hypothetical protein